MRSLVTTETTRVITLVSVVLLDCPDAAHSSRALRYCKHLVTVSEIASRIVASRSS
jgi:hypothetical protein